MWSGNGKTVVPGGTKREDLVNKDPKDLDAGQLEITALKDFGTMGLDDYEVDIEGWRLIVEGEVKQALRLTYSEVMSLPSIEKRVLMICPGFFANNGVWKGVSAKGLLNMAQVESGVNYVTLRGPEGKYEKVLKVPLADALSDRVFLACQVNGEPLAQKHGFPLRVVAEGYYGADWVKYVWKVTADKV